MPKSVLTIVALTLAACAPQSVEQQMAAAADKINSEKPHNVAWARVDGRRLIVHFVGSPSSSALSNDDIAKVASAGLCSLDEVRSTVKQGGSIRIEVGSDFDAAVTDVDHCPDA